MRLLVVEDDADVSTEVAEALERHGYSVSVVKTGREALERCDSFDLVLLDLGLPDLDGMQVARLLRERSAVPVIMVTARSEEIDRIMGLQIGADDYIVKPYSFRELIARIEAVLRRTSAEGHRPPEVGADLMQIGPLTIDVRRHRVTVAGREVRLTPKEFRLLELLSVDPGAVLSRDTILDEVWSQSWFGSTKTVDVHVSTLRKKLGDQLNIENIRGIGFRIQIAE